MRASTDRPGRGGASRLRVTLRGAVLAAAVLLVVLLPGRARAQTTLTLLPRVGVGVTDNPSSIAGQQRRDAYGLASVNASLVYDGARTNQSLSYRVAYMKFLRASQVDTLSNQLSWLSSYHLSGAWELGAGAEVMVTRTSQIATTAELTPPMLPQAAVGGQSLYLASNATQSLTYSPKADQTYRESLRVQYLQYLDAPQNAPTTLATIGSLGGEWLKGLNTYSAELDVTGAATSPTGGAGGLSGRLFMVGALGGWRRELSASWNGLARAGGAILFSRGDVAFEPLGLVGLEYHRAPWFATLSASHQVAPNMFTGDITTNNQAVLHVGVPLDRRELIVLSGQGAYTRARVVGGSQSTTAGAFDQWVVVGALTGHLSRLPFWASLEYTLVDQTNRSAAVGAAPNLIRQTLLLSVGGTFRWGGGEQAAPGTE